jgi:DNA-binding HxlR family transcriptional regulator
MSRCRKCQPVPEEVRPTAALLERRWQLSILYAALLGALRFNEFVEAIGDISARMLSERLGELEAAGLVEKAIVMTSPPHFEYRLTEKGQALAPVLEAMGAYSQRA